MTHIEVGGFSRIDKREARKLYEADKAVYICPVNLAPNNMWMPAIPMQSASISDDDNESFDSIVNTFEYYNCSRNDPDLGEYAAFYIKGIK